MSGVTPLSYSHPLWPEFASAVIESLDANGCDGTLMSVLTILRDDLGFSPAAAGESLQWLRDQGGYCTCECLNVIANAPDPDDDPDRLLT